MARVTPGFSFAFLQECFVATLLILAREETGLEFGLRHLRFGAGDGDLEQYVLWRVFKQQADMLRKQIKSDDGPEEAQVAGQIPWSAEPAGQELAMGGERSIEGTGKGRGEGMLPVLPGGKVRIINPAAFALV